MLGISDGFGYPKLGVLILENEWSNELKASWTRNFFIFFAIFDDFFKVERTMELWKIIKFGKKWSKSLNQLAFKQRPISLIDFGYPRIYHYLELGNDFLARLKKHRINRIQMNKIVPLFLQSHPKARAWNNSCKNVASNVECECELILQQKKLAVKFFIQISDTIFCILLDFCLIRLKLIIVFVCFLHQQVSFTTTFYYYTVKLKYL